MLWSNSSIYSFYKQKKDNNVGMYSVVKLVYNPNILLFFFRHNLGTFIDQNNYKCNSYVLQLKLLFLYFFKFHTKQNKFIPNLVESYQAGGEVQYLHKKLKTSFITQQNYFFFFLLNNGWGLLSGINYLPLTDYQILTNRITNINYLKYFLIFSKNFKYINPINTIFFTIQHLWQCWVNFTLFYLNIQYYEIRGLVFSRICHKFIVTYLNWVSSKFSIFIWRYFKNFFFFKYHNIQNISAILSIFIKTTQPAYLLYINILYHKLFIYHSWLAGILTIGLTDVAVEPWLLWYPIFCNGSTFENQFLFLISLLRIQIYSLNMLI